MILFILLKGGFLIAQKDSVTYYSNGTKKAQGKILDGKKIGLWNYFYEDGSILQEEHYDGARVATKIYNREGLLVLKGQSKVVTKTNKKQLKKHGPEYASTLYYQPVGTWKFYNDLGKIVEVNKYFRSYLYYRNTIRYKKKEDEFINPFKDVRYEQRIIDEDTLFIYPNKYDSSFTWFTNTKNELDPVNFLPDGKWAQFYKFDTIHIAHMFTIRKFQVHGVVDGYWPNGNIKSEWHFINGVKTGKWTNWNKDGTVKDVYYYNAGAIEEFQTFHRNGRVSTASKTLEKNDNYRVYQKTQWYEDGTRHSQGKTRHRYDIEVQSGLASFRFGIWEYFYPNGKLMQQGEYVDGEKHGEWKYFDDDGSPISTKKYKKGALIQTINH